MPTQGLFERQVLQQSWQCPDAFATTLLVLTVDTYGTEALSWDPRTLRVEINDDFGIELSQANFDRLMVACNLLVTDDFYRSLPDFVLYCNILNGDVLDPRLWDPADSQEIAWGISEALIIEPPDEEEPFSTEIRAYIGSVLDMEGIMNAPDILRVALRNADLTFNAQDFSDDPVMFDAIFRFEQSKMVYVNSYVRSQLARLAEQLTSLPLRSGTTRDVVQRVMQALS